MKLILCPKIYSASFFLLLHLLICNQKALFTRTIDIIYTSWLIGFVQKELFSKGICISTFHTLISKKWITLATIILHFTKIVKTTEAWNESKTCKWNVCIQMIFVNKGFLDFIMVKAQVGTFLPYLQVILKVYVHYMNWNKTLIQNIHAL